VPNSPDAKAIQFRRVRSVQRVESRGGNHVSDAWMLDSSAPDHQGPNRLGQETRAPLRTTSRVEAAASAGRAMK